MEARFSNYSEIYYNYKLKVQQSDAIRYFLLYEYGGVYVDLDMESLQPLDELLARYPCIIAQEPKEHRILLSENNLKLKHYALNSFMACRPKHPFMKFVIDMLKECQEYYPLDVLKSTGPMFLSDILDIYLSVYNSSNEEFVYMAPQEWFTPKYENKQEINIRHLCVMSNKTTKQEQDECIHLLSKHFNNKDSKRSYNEHYWTQGYRSEVSASKVKSIAHMVKGALVL